MKNIKMSKKFENEVKKGMSFVLSMLMIGTIGSARANNDNYDTRENINLLENKKSISLNAYEGVNIYINDLSYELVNEQGERVPAYIINGTTYVPPRALSTTFGANINWNSELSRVEIDTNNGITCRHLGEYKSDTPLFQSKVEASTNVSLYVNGKQFIPTDSAGNIVPIYVINGTTYIPLRAISTLFGIDICWDSEHNTVYLGNHLAQYDLNNKNYYSIWPNQKDYIAPRADMPSEEIIDRFLFTYEQYVNCRNLAEKKMPHILYDIGYGGYMMEYIECRDNGNPLGQKYIDLEYQILSDVSYIYESLDFYFTSSSEKAFESCTQLYESVKNNRNQYTSSDLTGYIKIIGKDVGIIKDLLERVNEENEKEFFDRFNELHEQFEKELVNSYGISKQLIKSE